MDKPRIKPMTWDIRRHKTNNQNNNKKKESKKMGIVSTAFGTTSSIPTFAPLGCHKDKTKGKILEIYLKK